MSTWPKVFRSVDALGTHVAAMIADGVSRAQVQGRPFVLGCPSGRTPAPVYAALAARVAAGRLDLRHVIIAMMDEYLVPGDGAQAAASRVGPGQRPPLPAPAPAAHEPVPRLVSVDPALAHSCRGFGLREILAPLNAAAGPGRGIAEGSLWLPDPADPEAYDDRLSGAGGVDLFLLATGASDGHIAFNPPGAERASRTRVVALPETTRRDNLATFPSFGGLAEVPTHGVSVGIATIAERSRAVVMIAHGADKNTAVSRIARASAYDPTWPATIVTECANATFVVDPAAARGLGSPRPSRSPINARGDADRSGSPWRSG